MEIPLQWNKETETRQPENCDLYLGLGGSQAARKRDFSRNGEAGKLKLLSQHSWCLDIDE